MHSEVFLDSVSTFEKDFFWSDATDGDLFSVAQAMLLSFMILFSQDPPHREEAIAPRAIGRSERLIDMIPTHFVPHQEW